MAETEAAAAILCCDLVLMPAAPVFVCLSDLPAGQDSGDG
jgi:hypothetical protein